MKKDLAQTKFAQFIAKRQELLNKTDEDISKALGFTRATIFPAIKNNAMRLPVNLVPKLARLLDVSASELLTIMLKEQMPDLLDVVKDAWVTDVTPNERKLLDAYRALARGRDVTPTVLDGTHIIALITA